MPSASTKIEKPIVSESADPLRQGITVIEHKIRNLEKRKSKLDSYKSSGKPLTKEQVEAVSKYHEVIQQIDLLKDITKQLRDVVVDNDKQRKRAAKKEALERTTTETAKIRQVLLIQDVLQSMGTEKIREDFLEGKNGAISLTEEDLKLLDDLYTELLPKHEGPTPFLTQLQKAAESLMSIVDGRGREMVGSTGAKINQLIISISTCGYFDQPEPAVPSEDSIEPELVADSEGVPTPVEVEVPVAAVNAVPPPQPEAAPPVAQPITQSIPTQNPMRPIIQNLVPVSQVESSMFNAQGFQPPNTNVGIPPLGQNAPINDVMSRVSSSFTFFQESELESSELGGALPQPNHAHPAAAGAPPPAAIPSRTFTNQNFNGQVAPAPLGYPTAPPTNPYFVAGYQPQNPPHYPQDVQIQGYGNGTLPQMQAQRPAAEVAPHGYSQAPQHINNTYDSSGPAAPSSAPASSQTAQPTQAYQPIPPVAPSEDPSPVRIEETKDEFIKDWAAPDSWGNEEFQEWNPQSDGNKNSNGSKPRGDRPPRSNYSGPRNNNNNRNNYNRGNRDRDSGNNGNYYNNHNGYQSRGDNKEFQPRKDRGDRGDMNGGGNREGGYGGYRPRGPPRGPRTDRPDRPERQDNRPDRNSAPRNNSGPPRPRGNRGPPGTNNHYRQDAQEAK